MKITVFSGSHKGREGNTLIMVEEFLKGAEEAGAETENIILTEKNIGYCKGKFECWLKTPGSCKMRDDMDNLIPKFMTSDIVVFACPVYFDNVPALMKNFIDRLAPVLLPHFEEDEQGEYRHAKRYVKYPKFIVFPMQACLDRQILKWKGSFLEDLRGLFTLNLLLKSIGEKVKFSEARTTLC